jgi:ADP-ribose pyrophosphatase YjhB (NUDIX family)
MEDRWLTWAKRLQAIASTGAHFTADKFDRERYEEIAAIANGMLAELAQVPVARVESLVPDFAMGYATPKVEVRGAVFERDRILLVREAGDGLWALPGGFADVGLSPSENIEKEVWEEATLRVRATDLYAVRHKARHAYRQDVRDFYKLFFICVRSDDSAPVNGAETSAVGFFARHELPPLSRGRTIEADIEAAFDYLRTPQAPAAFD